MTFQDNVSANIVHSVEAALDYIAKELENETFAHDLVNETAIQAMYEEKGRYTIPVESTLDLTDEQVRTLLTTMLKPAVLEKMNSSGLEDVKEGYARIAQFYSGSLQGSDAASVQLAIESKKNELSESLKKAMENEDQKEKSFESYSSKDADISKVYEHFLSKPDDLRLYLADTSHLEESKTLASEIISQAGKDITTAFQNSPELRNSFITEFQAAFSEEMMKVKAEGSERQKKNPLLEKPFTKSEIAEREEHAKDIATLKTIAKFEASINHSAAPLAEKIFEQAENICSILGREQLRTVADKSVMDTIHSYISEQYQLKLTAAREAVAAMSPEEAKEAFNKATIEFCTDGYQLYKGKYNLDKAESAFYADYLIDSDKPLKERWIISQIPNILMHEGYQRTADSNLVSEIATAFKKQGSEITATVPTIEPEEAKHYTEVLCEMIETMDFSLDKQENGKYCLTDDMDVYLGGIENYENFEDVYDIINKFDGYMDDCYFNDLEKAAENSGIDTNGVYSGVALERETAENWVKLMDEHEDFKKAHLSEYEAMKLISSPSEILDSINLDDVVQYFNSDKEKNNPSFNKD